MTQDHTRPNNATRDAEVKAAGTDHAPDRGPTPDEERAAESNRLDPGTARNIEEAAERGAAQKGEGRIAG